MIHEFTILLEGSHTDFEAAANSIYDLFDDVLVSECRGVMAIEFARESDTFEAAMIPALVTLLENSIKVSRVEPNDLVGVSEIAKRINHSRQSVHQYISGTRGDGAFPLPTANLEGNQPLWHWQDVVAWLVENGIWGTDASLESTKLIAIVNACLELMRHPGHEKIFDALKARAA